MGTSTTPTVGGFSDQEIQDVTKTVLSKLTDGAGRPIEWDKLSSTQQQGYVDAAKASITGERTAGFTNYLLDGYRSPDQRTPDEVREYTAQVNAVADLEREFGKLARNEFDRRRIEA